MPTKAQRNIEADASAAQLAAVNAAIQSEVSILQGEMEHESALLPAPDATGVDISAEALAVLNLQAALTATADASPMRPILQAALDAALQVQADVEAQAALRAEQDAEETQARTLALANNLPAYVLDAMLEAIDAKYAPAPIEADAPEVAAPAPTNNRKQPGAVTLARNATVAEALTTDAALAARADSTIDAYLAVEAKIPCSVQSLAGTRFAGVVTFAIDGSGVANAADFVTLTTAIRIRLAQRGYGPGGLSACSVPWISATGAHAPGQKKASDTLRLKFADGRAVALYPDGRFRYAKPGTPNVRFIHADAAALAVFNGGAASSAPSAPQTPQAPTPPTTAPQAPSAPTSASASASSGLTQTARCADCNVRNVLDAPQCKACGLTDWQVTE